MDQNQNYKEKYERVKLHSKYLFIIAGILAVIGFSLAFGRDNVALGQISMASTVSSIILSSIAIFMSISGENKLNYTQNTLMETSDRLFNISNNIEQANSLFDGAIDQKLSKLDEISDRLEKIGQSVDKVEKEVFGREFRANENSTFYLSKEKLWKIYERMIGGQNNIVNKIVKITIEYIIVCLAENATFEPDNMDKYLESVIKDSDVYFEGFAMGILGVFTYSGIKRAETVEYFQEKMALSQEQRDEIKKFL